MFLSFYVSIWFIFLRTNFKRLWQFFTAFLNVATLSKWRFLATNKMFMYKNLNKVSPFQICLCVFSYLLWKSTNGDSFQWIIMLFCVRRSWIFNIKLTLSSKYTRPSLCTFCLAIYCYWLNRSTGVRCQLGSQYLLENIWWLEKLHTRSL